MIGKYTAAAVLLLALAGCGSSQSAKPATPSPTGTAACRQALVEAYRLHQTGVDTGDMPKPPACAGIPDDAYLQLALQVMHGASTGS